MAILGIDEVGRGPWAGPLVVGACILPTPIDGLSDSKKLSIKKREELAQIIQEKAIYGLGWISSEEVDSLGLIPALKKATGEAVKQINSPFHEIIIDGTINFLVGTPLEKYVQTIPKADFLVPEVSAASIIAKVSRDHYMYELARKYPGYGFEKHVGYGTKAHIEAIQRLGLCPEHRRSFKPIAEFANAKGDLSAKITTSGQKAEQIAADWLTKKGHKILARNWKNKFCEIDIVSELNNTLYFTEVKYRRNIRKSDGVDAVNAKKYKQMKFAAELYIQNLENEQPATLAVMALSGDNYKVTDFLVLD